MKTLSEKTDLLLEAIRKKVRDDPTLDNIAKYINIYNSLEGKGYDMQKYEGFYRVCTWAFKRK